MALTISNAYLTQAQMDGNAQYIANWLSAKGWTRNSIAAILGNMQRESNINPGLWESLLYGNTSGGYGLTQWTPASKYLSWAQERGYPYGSDYSNAEAYINGQLQRIVWEVENNQQWIATSAFNFSFSAFTKSTQTAAYLTEAFLKNYERAGVEALSDRITAANRYYNVLQFGADTETLAIIKKAVEWAISIANDDSHGYDQDSRWGPDYDCSSLVIQAWQNAGVPVKAAGATYTGNMYSVFLQNGFNDVTGSVNLSNGDGMQYGDVLLNTEHHTAMHIGNGQMVQASINENGGAHGGQIGDQTGKEIWTTSYKNYPWNYVLRYKSGGGNGGSSGGGESGGDTDKKIYIVRWIPG